MAPAALFGRPSSATILSADGGKVHARHARAVNLCRIPCRIPAESDGEGVVLFRADQRGVAASKRRGSRPIRRLDPEAVAEVRALLGCLACELDADDGTGVPRPEPLGNFDDQG